VVAPIKSGEQNPPAIVVDVTSRAGLQDFICLFYCASSSYTSPNPAWSAKI